jgi:hypothetical protein
MAAGPTRRARRSALAIGDSDPIAVDAAAAALPRGPTAAMSKLFVGYGDG